MAKRVFLDIETLPAREERRTEIAREVEASFVAQNSPFDEVEIETLIEEKFREMSLQAEAGRVLTIGLIIEDDAQVFHQGLLGRSRDTNCFHVDEARTLQSFWNLMKEFNLHQDLIVGHNLLDFDLPFIYKRSIINGVKPTLRLPFVRFRNRPIYDTMQEWNHWRRSIKLTDIAQALGLRSSKLDGIDGANVYDHFRNGQHDEIALYCMRDVELVREIYYRMEFMPAPYLEPYETKYSSLLSLMKAYR